MKTHYDIVPGESIGPFRLGMTRDEIAALNVGPMAAFEDDSGAEFTSLGVRVTYEKAGCCRRIEARVFGSDKTAASFSLAGRPVDNLSEREAREIFRSLAPDLTGFYAGFGLPSLGLRAVKWEHSDDVIFAIVVERPHNPET